MVMNEKDSVKRPSIFDDCQKNLDINKVLRERQVIRQKIDEKDRILVQLYEINKHQTFKIT